MKLVSIFFLTLFSTGVFSAPKVQDLNGLQWGLSNRGQSQKIEIDQVTNFRVQGRAGEDIHLPESSVPNQNTAQRKIRVAVLDTGVDVDHPNLKGRIAINPSECWRSREKSTCGSSWDSASRYAALESCIKFE